MNQMFLRYANNRNSGIAFGAVIDW